jgi:RNA polymerase sigma factor (sigma-70 family)
VIFNTEKALIKKAQAGHKQAWLTLVKRYEQQVFNQCLRMVNNRDDACDLMQESFVSVFKSLSSFSGDSQFSTWLFKITHARCMDHYRRVKPVLVTEEEPFDEGLEANLIADVDNQDIHHALKQLPFEQRQIIELKFFQHLTFEDIASVTGLSVNTVKTRLYSALKKMKGHLEVVYG